MHLNPVQTSSAFVSSPPYVEQAFLRRFHFENSTSTVTYTLSTLVHVGNEEEDEEDEEHSKELQNGGIDDNRNSRTTPSIPIRHGSKSREVSDLEKKTDR